MGNTTCAPCRAGSFSLGGGIRLTNWMSTMRWTHFDGLGLSFRTYCRETNNPGVTIPPSNCSGWEIEDGLIHSGDTADGQSSVLELGVRLVTPGHVRFLYRVEAEEYFDGLTFYVDGDVAMQRVSNKREFVSFSVNITNPGIHYFEWVFSKDVSVSIGDDQAQIRMIEIEGTSFADDECTLCPAGTYSGPNANDCTLCPANSFSNTEGSSSCTQCEPTRYAPPGSVSCSPRPPCTEADFERYYSPCRSGRVRDMFFRWREPKICSELVPGSIHLPPPEYNVGCAECNPGTFRPAEDSTNCVPCPVNTISGFNAIECRPCETGSVGIRKLVLRTWKEWPPFVTNNCTMQCGSPGWRLQDTHIDSGIGHGTPVEVTLSINVTLEQPGTVSFEFTFECNRTCYFTFWDSRGPGRFYMSPYSNRTVRESIPLTTGQHTLFWVYEQYEPSTADKVLIRYIEVTGVSAAFGGAEECTPCPAGYYAPHNLSSCLPCGYGRVSEGFTDRCDVCPSDTFSEVINGSKCFACGHATSAPPGSKECFTNCTYSPDNGVTVYDFSPLKSTKEMYGPVYDPRGHQYFLNICSKEHTNHSCFDRDGRPIPSYACQITNNGYGVDLGHVISFWGGEVKEGKEEPVVIEFTHGTPGCANPERNQTAVSRGTNVTFICDGSAGIGYPEPDGEIEDPNHPCRYKFLWRSTYACPLCTPSHYSYYYTECVHGKQRRVWYWLTNPRRCHDGVQLPPSDERSCSTDDKLVCPAGTHKVDQCEACSAGSFSVGGGNVWRNFVNIPPEFTTRCLPGVANCGKWTVRNGALVATTNGSVLELTINWVRRGVIRTTYQALLIHGQHLQIRIDGHEVFKEYKPEFDFVTKEINVDVGTHKIAWIFTQDMERTDKQKYGFISIYNVEAVGTKWSDSECVRCPSGYYQPNRNATKCIPCPRDTYADGEGRTSCSPCPADQWAPEGSRQCYPRPQCSLQDYTPVFTPCVHGSHIKRWQQNRPVFCKGSFTPPPESQEPCTCLEGQFVDNQGNCKSCDAGKSYVGGQCVDARKGSAAILVNHLFPRGRTSNELPSNWIAGCTGTCASGWRMNEDGIDSGIQIGLAVSWLTIPVDLVVDGYLTIDTVEVNGGSEENFFQLFIDGVLYAHYKTTQRQPTRINLAKGQHAVTFLWRQGATRIGKRHVMQSFSPGARVIGATVTGASQGIAVTMFCPPGFYSDTDRATTCTPCPPGTASNATGATSCEPCRENTYAAEPASTQCYSCGNGGSAAPGASNCQTTCRFSVGNRTISLRDIGSWIPEVQTLTGRRYLISVCQPLDTDSCKNKNGQRLRTHVCALEGMSDTSGIDYGKNFNFAPGPISSNGTLEYFTITFNNGEPCPSTDPSLPTRFRKTTIRFKCNLSAETSPVFNSQQVNPNDRCEDIFFDWAIPQACALCEWKRDFINNGASECVDRKQNVSWSPVGCYFEGINGSKQLPVIETVDCVPEVKFPTMAVVIGVTIFILLIAVMAIAFIIVYMKNRKLTAQYTLLKDAHAQRLDTALEGSDNEL